MKKLMLIAYIVLALLLKFAPFASAGQEPQVQVGSKKPSGQGQLMMKAMAARLGALKKYFSEREETVSEKITASEFPREFRFTYEASNLTFSLQGHFSEIFNDVVFYQLSPRKKYFIIFQNTIAGVATRTLGRFLGAKASARIQMIFIDPHTGKTVASFDPGNIITYSFDPSEELLLIAGVKKPWGTLFGLTGPSSVHASKTKNFRQPSETGAILYYDIYDLASPEKNKVIKTLENIQAIQFSAPKTLLVKYDDQSTEKILFQETSPSFFSSIRNIFSPYYGSKTWKSTEEVVSTEESKMLIGAMYDDKMRVLNLTMPVGKVSHAISFINSYHVSPAKKFIIINKPKEGVLESVKQTTGTSNATTTVFLNAQTGQGSEDFLNVITYEFNSDETRLMILYTKSGYFNNEESPKYRLFDTTANREIKTFGKVQFGYFEKTDSSQSEKLIVIDKNGERTEYNSQTGMIFSKIGEQEEEKREWLSDSIKAVITRGPASVYQIGSEITADMLKGATTTLSNFAKGFTNYFGWQSSVEKLSPIDEVFRLVEYDSAAIQQSQEKVQDSSEVEEISSSAITKELEEGKTQKLRSLIQHIVKLDSHINTLNSSEWPDWKEKQESLLESIKPALLKIIQEIRERIWQERNAQILQDSGRLAIMGMAGATIALAGEGSDEMNDVERIVKGLAFATSHLIATVGELFIEGPGAQITSDVKETGTLSKIFFDSSQQNKIYKLKITPTFIGPIQKWITDTVAVQVQEMFEPNQEIAQSIKSINTKQLFPSDEQIIVGDNNGLAEAIAPQIQKAIVSEETMHALTQIGLIFFQSAVFGAFLYSADLFGTSFIDQSMASLVGAVQGAVGALAVYTNNTTPESLLIMAPQFDQNLLGTTGTDALVTAIKSTVAVITNVIANEEKQSGGLLDTLQKGASAFGSVVGSRVLSLWGTIGSALSKLDEVESPVWEMR